MHRNVGDTGLAGAGLEMRRLVDHRLRPLPVSAEITSPGK